MIKISIAMLVLLGIIAWCQSRPEPKKKIKMPDTDVERWRKEMVKHWRS